MAAGVETKGARPGLGEVKGKAYGTVGHPKYSAGVTFTLSNFMII